MKIYKIPFSVLQKSRRSFWSFRLILSCLFAKVSSFSTGKKPPPFSLKVWIFLQFPPKIKISQKIFPGILFPSRVIFGVTVRAAHTHWGEATMLIIPCSFCNSIGKGRISSVVCEQEAGLLSIFLCLWTCNCTVFSLGVECSAPCPQHGSLPQG